MEFNNFMEKPLHNGGTLHKFRDMDAHISTFSDSCINHITFEKPKMHDFSLETRTRLDNFDSYGGLERRTNCMDAYNHSPMNLEPPTPPMFGGGLIPPSMMGPL